jgi:hypothetical protein
LNQLIDFWKKKNCFKNQVLKEWLKMAEEKQKRISMKNDQRKVAESSSNFKDMQLRDSSVSCISSANHIDDSNSRNKIRSNAEYDSSLYHIDSQRLTTNEKGVLLQKSNKLQNNIKFEGELNINSTIDNIAKNQLLSNSTEEHRESFSVAFPPISSSSEIHQQDIIATLTPSPPTTQESIEDQYHTSSSSKDLENNINRPPSIFFDENLSVFSASFFIDQLARSFKAPRRIEMVAHHLLQELAYHREISFRYKLNYI